MNIDFGNCRYNFGCKACLCECYKYLFIYAHTHRHPYKCKCDVRHHRENEMYIWSCLTLHKNMFLRDVSMFVIVHIDMYALPVWTCLVSMNILNKKWVIIFSTLMFDIQCKRTRWLENVTRWIEIRGCLVLLSQKIFCK